jgi:hypothetical protein
MSSLNHPDHFSRRVNFAAAVISAGRRTTRNFDNCFENYDGDAVCAALIRRAERNPKIAANIWRYLHRATAEAAAEKLAGRNLAEAAAELRARANGGRAAS